MIDDIRYATRVLLRKPLLTAVAVASLALGIGVNAALFSMFDQVLLRRLPVAAADEIVNVTSPGPRTGNSSIGDEATEAHVFSYPLFRDLERLEAARAVFTGIAAHSAAAVNLALDGQTSSGNARLVSGSYFPVLGIRPALGRLISPDDDRVIGGHNVVVLSHAYWQTQFGSSPAVLNETLAVNGQPMTIVGVAPRGFRGMLRMERPQVFIPLAMAGQIRRGWNGIESRREHWLYVFGRLKPGMTMESAEAALTAPFGAILKDLDLPAQGSMTDRTRAQFLGRRIELEEGGRGLIADREEVSTALTLLFSVTGLVLLIACANVANLLLARASDRSSEMAIRAAMGASSRRIARLLLTEACLLAALGGIGAILIARATLVLLMSVMPPEDGGLIVFALNASVVVFTAGLTIGTALLFGLFPALHSSKPDLVPPLKAQSGQSSGSRATSRFRTAVVTAQIALATALLAQAGLFIKSLVNVTRVDLGIQTEELVTFSLSPLLNGYTLQRTLAFFDQVENAVRALPGVTGVTASTVSLVNDDIWGTNVSVQGFTAAPDSDTESAYTLTGAEYFRTLGVSLIAGREFTAADGPGTPKVAIVNEAFARKFNLGPEVIGMRMRMGSGGPLDIEIVGLVPDHVYNAVKDVPPPQFFLPYRQGSRSPQSLTFYVRAGTNLLPILTAVPDLVRQADPTVPVAGLRLMDDQIRENLTLDRVMATFSTAFATLATLLAASGLYGVLAYSVARRWREIGIRMALGAGTWQVRRLVFSQIGRIALVGGAIGCTAALALGRLGGSLLFEVDGYDPAVIGGAAALVLLVAIAAGALPARRAARVEPVQALRHE